MPDWKPIRYRAEYWLLSAAAWAIPKLPRRSCAALADFAGAVVYAADGRGRAVALANLACAFPEAPEAWRRAVAKRSYQTFARSMLDLFWSTRLTRESVGRYVDFGDTTEIAAAAEGREVAMVVTAHYGTFEWGYIAFSHRGFRGMGVGETFKNPLLKKVFDLVRGCGGNTPIEQEGAMLKMFKHMKRGGSAASLVDLTIPPSQAATVVRAFGRLISAPVLHAALAQRMNCPVFLLLTEPRPDGTAFVRVLPALRPEPGESAHSLARRCWALLEAEIRKKPWLWLWAYKHWRFLPKDAAEPYPFYANPNGKFEKLRKEVGDL